MNEENIDFDYKTAIFRVNAFKKEDAKMFVNKVYVNELEFQKLRKVSQTYDSSYL